MKYYSKMMEYFKKIRKLMFNFCLLFYFLNYYFNNRLRNIINN